ncbi:MAG: [Fe-Fe] hydrogenase large subunit C-terminal domain-containing protein [Salinivirgaceae bacterium]|nr:[Fe-Fe] hydrogenase large subunit C-terminal domain-containing protein [Salinivirgaceae bacterium]
MTQKAFHHALKVDNDLCYGCTHCMTVCPTEAIRVRNGKAIIYEHKCIDCGMCFKVCPVQAIKVEQDDFSTIFNYKHRVALYPSTLPGQFDSEFSIKQIIACLHELGFTDVFEVEHGADFLVDDVKEYMKEHSDTKPLISSFCPAIVRLIQVKFPSLVQNIITRKPPLDVSALYYRKKLEDQGVDPKDIGIFYITPCAAKIAAVKSPVGEEHSSVDGVINIDLIYNRVLLLLKNHTPLDTEKIEEPTLRHTSIRWSLTNGEADRFDGRCLAIDEVHNAIDFLERLETDQITNVDFVEIRACDESCAGGILNVSNRFITVERMKKRARRHKEFLTQNPVQNPLLEYSDYLKEKCRVIEIEPRSMMKMDEDTNIALNKLEKAQKMLSYLPGIDCGVCGAPTCQALSEDIVQKNARLTDCVFMRSQMEDTGSLTHIKSIQIMKDIWGDYSINKVEEDLDNDK